MTQHLFIVSRTHPHLYQYLARTFSKELDVEVFVDRRRGSRREQPERRAVGRGDRRIADRRTAAQVGHDLRALGYAFVRQS